MKEPNNCPNCGLVLKSGLMSNVHLIDDRKVAIINAYHSETSEGYCNKCGKELFNTYKSTLVKERKEITNSIRKLIKSVPVISAHAPLNWDYSVLDMVTGQSTTGTGVISEFTSSFTDLIGSQSGRHNQKLRQGELICFAQLRTQAINMGGNAVIATDIDYSELGAGKGMIMVCMAGTAVKLNNPEILGKEKSAKIDELHKLNLRLNHLSQFKIPQD